MLNHSVARSLLGFAIFIAVSLCGNKSALAQSMSLESAKAAYKNTVSSASKRHQEAVTKADAEYSKVSEAARQQIVAAYESVIKQAALRNDTASVAKYAKELEEFKSGEAAPARGTATQGSLIDGITGKWESENKSLVPFVTFEFRRNKDALKTITFPTDGGKSTQSESFRMQAKADRLVLLSDKKGPPGYSFYYEITSAPENGKLLVMEVIASGQQTSRKEMYLVAASGE